MARSVPRIGDAGEPGFTSQGIRPGGPVALTRSPVARRRATDSDRSARGPGRRGMEGAEEVAVHPGRALGQVGGRPRSTEQDVSAWPIHVSNAHALDATVIVVADAKIPGAWIQIAAASGRHDWYASTGALGHLTSRARTAVITAWLRRRGALRSPQRRRCQEHERQAQRASAPRPVLVWSGLDWTGLVWSRLVCRHRPTLHPSNALRREAMGQGARPPLVIA